MLFKWGAKIWIWGLSHLDTIWIWGLSLPRVLSDQTPLRELTEAEADLGFPRGS